MNQVKQLAFFENETKSKIKIKPKLKMKDVEYRHTKKVENIRNIEGASDFEGTERAATQSVRKPTGPDIKPKEVIANNFSEDGKSQIPECVQEHAHEHIHEQAQGLFKACSHSAQESVQRVHTQCHSPSNQVFTLLQENCQSQAQAPAPGQGDVSEKVLLYILDQGENALIKIRYQELAQELGCSISTLRRALNKLKGQKYIETYSSSGKPGVGIRLTEHALNTLEQTHELALEHAQSQSQLFSLAVPMAAPVTNCLKDLEKKDSHTHNSDRDLLFAAQELEQRIKRQAMKNLGLSFFSPSSNSESQQSAQVHQNKEKKQKLYSVLFEFAILLTLTIIINFIMIKFAAIYFSKVEKIPGVSGGLVFSVLEAFTIYLSATMTRSRGFGKIMKLGAILTLIGLSLGLTLKGSWDSLHEDAAKSRSLSLRTEEIRSQISTLDRRIEGYLAKEWRSAALKLEQEKLALIPELRALTSNQSNQSETILGGPSDQKKQFFLMLALRVILELMNIFCCSRLGEIFFKELSFKSLFERSRSREVSEAKGDSDVYARMF